MHLDILSCEFYFFSPMQFVIAIVWKRVFNIYIFFHKIFYGVLPETSLVVCDFPVDT